MAFIIKRKLEMNKVRNYIRDSQLNTSGNLHFPYKMATPQKDSDKMDESKREPIVSHFQEINYGWKRLGSRHCKLTTFVNNISNPVHKKMKLNLM
ncbi:hypothetical protein COBT_000964 [Conglomerata obtusa]